MFCTEYNDPINEKNPVLTIPDINLLFLLGAIVLDFHQATFLLNNVDEVTPNPEEIAALNAYHSGDPDYQPAMSQKEVLKELGL